MSEDIVKTLLNMMTPEQKAELMSKLQDPNLPIENTTHPPKGEVKPHKNTTRDIDDFTMTKDASAQIEVKHERVNLFTDDGKEHKDVRNETPEVEQTERKRGPTNKVEQSCESCSAKVKVHPLHSREFFVCDKCLRSKAV
tara:strand:- start:290 stop:709 length:420 start_codon:yes stop_codon:yes gene_type:complete